MDDPGFEGIGDFSSDDPWQRYIAHQAAKGNYPPPTENEYGYLGTFLMKVELGNAAMSDLDHLADALELVAVQVRNRMEYPMPVLDINGNTCGEWTVIPYES